MAAAFITGGVLGLVAGLRLGTWWAFTRLAEFERKQRAWRARHWRSRAGG